MEKGENSGIRPGSHHWGLNPWERKASRGKELCSLRRGSRTAARAVLAFNTQVEEGARKEAEKE